jgi:hypothetical protein
MYTNPPLRILATAALIALTSCSPSEHGYTVKVQRHGQDGKPMPPGGGYPFLHGTCSIQTKNGLHTEEVTTENAHLLMFKGSHISCSMRDDAMFTLGFSLTITREDGSVLGESEAPLNGSATVAGS